MHIIGTAGHVDHGKTSLIEALTGINADRLPEEKKRGMTIDLGFAHFKGNNGEPIGVIDVPGHERFIRNMAAGAWSLSCAVIVIAGNEGWMQQTEDHARVLEAMGINSIICALTKTDITEKNTLPAVKKQISENLWKIFKKDIEILPVSSITGEGMEELKKSILGILNTVTEEKIQDSAYINIDRVFTVKGTGTIVTGSLSGDKLSEGDELTILPGGQKTRVRGIQSYYSAVKTAYPVSRVACNLHGIKKENIKRGYSAVKNKADFYSEKEFIIKWEESDSLKKSIKNHMELEIACGTGHYTGRIHFLKTKGYARIVLNEEAAVSWLSPCIFIQQGGHRILGKGCFIWPGKTDKKFRIKLSETIKKYPVPDSVSEEAVLKIILYEWYKTKTEKEKNSVKDFASLENFKIIEIKDTIITEERFKKESNKLLKLCKRQGGISLVEYNNSGDLPLDIKEFLIDKGLKENIFIQKNQLLISTDQLEKQTELSPLGKKILQLMSRQKNKGLQLKEIKEQGAKTELRHLVRMEKIVALEDEIYFSTPYFNKLVSIILESFDPGVDFSIPQAKEKTGLSRRYVIPLLNKMEHMGMLKRAGNNRVVL